MAPPSRRDAASLREELFERAPAFEFFQAVRLLHKLHSDRERVGRDVDPADEAVRFRSDTSYAFPEGDIREIVAGEAGRPDEMVVKFLGIVSPGSFGSLPTPYIEEVRRQERVLKNPAMREFFDVFNHRLVSLFYRAWERSRLPVLRDLGGANPFEDALFALAGLHGASFAGRMPLEQTALLARAGLLSMHPAPASAMCATLESLFGVPTRIEQFVPAWYPIDRDDQNRLGLANSRLGEDLNLGEQVLLAQSRFRVELGPLDGERFRELLPGGGSFEALSSVVRLACGVEFDFEVQLVLEAADVPETRLYADDDPSPTQLGRTSWLRTQPFTEDARAAVFEPALRSATAAGR